MPTTEVPLRWVEHKEHLRKLSVASKMLLHGAHNEVHDLTTILAADLTHWPNGGTLTPLAITGFADAGGGDTRATISAAHPLVVGDTVVIATAVGAAGGYEGHHTVTAVDTVGFDVDFTFTYIVGTGATGAVFYQGLDNIRITPDTVAVISPVDANAAAMVGSATGIYHVSEIGHIDFYHAAGAVASFKLILFGD